MYSYNVLVHCYCCDVFTVQYSYYSFDVKKIYLNNTIDISALRCFILG